jgi:TIR domain
MNPKLFLSYRRDDSAAFAGRIEDRLQSAFGRNLLFMDVDNVPLGVNFAKVLHDEVGKCEVLLAVIGRNWLGAEDDQGKRRLDDPDDFVRIEIAAALRRDIPVIPILLDGATVPKADELPGELKELALRNGLNVNHASFHNDVDRLIKRLKALRRAEHIKLVGVGCGAGLLMGVLFNWWWLAWLWTLEGAPPFLTWIGPLYQRAFEWAVFIFCGAAAAVLRQRYRLPRAVAVSGLLAWLVFAIELLFVSPHITNLTPALYGETALIFYSIVVILYCLVLYGAFSLHDRTSRVIDTP